MADTESVFGIGSIIVITPAVGADIEAEVAAFDPKTKFLCVKTKGTKATQVNIATINLDNVKNISIKSEADENATPPPVSYVDSNSIARKLEKKTNERKRLMDAMNMSVPLDARKIFLRAGKLFDIENRKDNPCSGSATRWSQNNEIIVMESIAITPPYTSDCVVPYSSLENKVLENNLPGQRLDFVKKFVDKYYDEKRAQELQTESAVSTERSAV